MNPSRLAALASAVALAALSAPGFAQESLETRPPNADEQTPAFDGQTRAPRDEAGVDFDVTAVAEGLEFPWGLAFLPDGRMLVTERPGRLRIVGPGGAISAPVEGLPEIEFSRQGGLLDVALDPAFAENGYVYLSFSETDPEGGNHTAAARGRLIEDGAGARLDDVEVIYRQAPSIASPFHFGSRLVFLPDGTLLIAQGERGIEQGRTQARDLGSLLGKIVRINTDGSIPEDNPFVGVEGARPEIYSLGHRNIQGAALHPETGLLWEVEHGTRGGDEINVVEPGADYGWPDVAYGIEYQGAPIREGVTALEGTVQPIYYWDPVIAPGGMAFYTSDAIPEWTGSLFVSGLNSRHLARLALDGDRVVGEERLLEDRDVRLRAVVQGPDGALYVTTDPCGNGGANCVGADEGEVLRLGPGE